MGDNQPGVTVSMSMEGDMGQTAATRAIGYETDDNTGFQLLLVFSTKVRLKAKKLLMVVR